ncbi:MAG: hypothetical protein J0G32_05065 [Alphaproteobacteria bacterium]|nr:hypothetical protein [Alphaproteobacteria bacterium]OJV11943.1 MAG: hypothetical protein BGO27_00565 [Alphaproteobacteria bacterium 33-17]
MPLVSITECYYIAAIVLSISFFNIVLSRIAGYFNIQDEFQRKAVHVTVGIATISYPFIFDSYHGAILTNIILVALSLLIKKVKFFYNLAGKSLYAVKRKSKGEFYFLIGSGALAYLSMHNIFIYVVSMSLLTFSDTVAALIGVNYAKVSFSGVDGKKSYEGMFTFFIFSLVLILITMLLLSDNLSIPHKSMVVIATITAIVVTIIEACAWDGLDNILIPLSTYSLLSNLIPKPLSVLMLDLSSIMVFLVLVYYRKDIRLMTQAKLGLLLIAFYLWVVKGLWWLLPFVIVRAVVPFLVKIEHEARFDIKAVISMGGAPFVWSVISQHFPNVNFYTAVLTAAISTLSILVIIRLDDKKIKISTSNIVLYTSVACALIMPIYYLYDPKNIKEFIIYHAPKMYIICCITTFGFVRFCEVLSKKIPIWKRHFLFTMLASGLGMV